ncbi:MAG: hypothetical protein K1X72_22315 [Pyrinomonadaceae bacterium]|nr:hypothetical protein [Pyrinomonadaceae bacterium]
MKTVVVNQNGKTFSAVSGKNKSFGKTVGEAIDALEKQTPGEPNSVIYIQDFQPDEFFTAEQQRRLSELMQKFKDNDSDFSAEEKKELEKLIDEELEGSAKRVAKIAEKLGK